MRIPNRFKAAVLAVGLVAAAVQVTSVLLPPGCEDLVSASRREATVEEAPFGPDHPVAAAAAEVAEEFLDAHGLDEVRWVRSGVWGLGGTDGVSVDDGTVWMVSTLSSVGSAAFDTTSGALVGVADPNAVHGPYAYRADRTRLVAFTPDLEVVACIETSRRAGFHEASGRPYLELFGADPVTLDAATLAETGTVADRSDLDDAYASVRPAVVDGADGQGFGLDSRWRFDLHEVPSGHVVVVDHTLAGVQFLIATS